MDGAGARISITEAEIIEALRAASSQGNGQDGLTIAEIRERTGWGLVRARDSVRSQIKAGRMKPCRVMREYLDGRLAPVSGYRWVG